MTARTIGVLAALLALGGVPASAYQTAPNSSGDPSYRSVIRAIEPFTPGLSARVLGHDNLVRLDNRSGHTVIVYGYSGDQYARLLADSTVQLNLRSPAFYLNEYRFGDQKVPSYADARAPPQWRTMDHSGELLWHDHRIHAAKSGAPRGTRRNSLLRAYRIPMQVGSRRGAIAGDLYWVGPTGSSASWQLFALPPATLLLLLLFYDTVRRGRRRQRQPA